MRLEVVMQGPAWPLGRQEERAGTDRRSGSAKHQGAAERQIGLPCNQWGGQGAPGGCGCRVGTVAVAERAKCSTSAVHGWLWWAGAAARAGKRERVGRRCVGHGAGHSRQRLDGAAAARQEPPQWAWCCRQHHVVGWWGWLQVCSAQCPGMVLRAIGCGWEWACGCAGHPQQVPQ